MYIRVQISKHTQEILQEISRETGKSPTKILEQAVLAYSRREFHIDKLNQAYSNLRKKQNAWKQELAERRELEQTTADGLEDE